MNVILLDPNNIENAKMDILENIKYNPVFVCQADTALCDYISDLSLKEKIQSQMLICKELQIDVMFKQNDNSTRVFSFSELLKLIGDEECEVVVLGDINATEEKIKEVRCQLCEIIQQFIYINIQLDTVHVCTEKEDCDNKRIRAFEKQIEQHKKNLACSLDNVKSLSEDKKKYRSRIIEHLENINKYLAEAQNNELIITVAATKKSGKSVIVNSMIECEIAPTSLEIATPNNCIYRCSDDGKYHLKYQNSESEDENPEKIRSVLLDMFREAGKDYENGLVIPDMELWYPSSRNGFSYYTVYDTPGPNLAGASGQIASADRGVSAADVIIFTINYSNHLTTDEYNYLKKVWKMCQEKGKQYSLILNVNQLDRRYESEGDKSSVRIVDNIRTKLINTGKTDGIDFRNCVVIGTSALTYFNAVQAPTFRHPNGDCSILVNAFSGDNIDHCINQYDDSNNELSNEYENRAISALNQLFSMIRQAKTFHKIEIESLEQMKQFSGMPNLLSYVEYISTQKARNEKINNLMFLINSEYTAIMNLFHIEELMQKLQENKELLEKAKKILKEFEESMKKILDPEYNDLYYDYDKIIEIEPETYSVYLNEITKKRPIRPKEDIGKFHSNHADIKFSASTILNELIAEEIPFKLEKRLKKEYGDDKKKLLKIDSVLVTYSQILSEVCTETLVLYSKRRIEEFSNNLVVEERAIKKTFEYIWEQRLNEIRAAIANTASELSKDCSVDFNIKVPDFQIVFGCNPAAADIEINRFASDALIDVISKALIENNAFEKGIKDGIVGFIRKIKGRKNQILLEDVLNLYNGAKLGVDIKCVYEKDGTLFEYLKNNLCEPMKKDMDQFLDNLDADINVLIKNTNESTEQIISSIDNSKEIQEEVEELSKERESLINLKKAIKDFQNSWNEVM